MVMILLMLLVGAPLYVSQASQESLNQVSPVIVGIPVPLSGSLKYFGIMMKNSFEMAMKSINEKGGINGQPLEIVYADD